MVGNAQLSFIRDQQVKRVWILFQGVEVFMNIAVWNFNQSFHYSTSGGELLKIRLLDKK